MSRVQQAAHDFCPRRLVDLGGDWDRRNRLKVYEAVFSLMKRDLSRAASLFLVRLYMFSFCSATDCDLFFLFSGFSCYIHLHRTYELQ